MKIAIQGHPTRGKEVIQILESLGGINKWNHAGECVNYTYYIDHCNNIYSFGISGYHGDRKIYTLEEFEKEFPFKIGDKVKHITSVGTIKEYCYIDNEPTYKVKSIELGIIATIPVKILEPYKEMEKRNIILTLDKAKEWYKKGGELKEIALQAFTEKELTKIGLPKTWEEFRENNPVKVGECWLAQQDIIHQASDSSNRTFKNWIPSKKSAEAHLALIQLEQLRDCWRQGWKPEYHTTSYAIKRCNDEIHIIQAYSVSAFLSFPTQKMAEDFLVYFRDLIEKAGDLI